VIERSNPEIDVDALMAEIRTEVMRARQAAGAAAGAGPPGGALAARAEAAPGAGDPAWFGLRDQLHVAEQHAAVGLEVPAFVRYGGLKRRLARALARVVLFLAQVVTVPQRTYNAAMLTALRVLAERVRLLEAERAERARPPARGPAAEERSGP
jgi:hypothetical protein